MKKTTDDNEIIPEEGVQEREAADTENGGADESVVAEESAQEVIKSLREKLKKSQAEKNEYLDGWQRAKADLINARKRDEESRREYIQFANERLIEELLPVLDSFHMAMANKEAWEKVDKNWRVGVEYIAQQLDKTLADAGLKELNPIGQPYDVNIHEAVSTEQVENPADAGKVTQVLQKGYSLNGKVLKAPKVKVGETK